MNTKPHSAEAINIITLGCSRNLVDSEFLMKQIDACGLKVMHNKNGNEARTVIINTCGFIHDARQESVDTILQYIKAKEQGYIDRVFVMGCLSERYRDELKNEIPEVDKYFGINDLKSIIQTVGLDYKLELAGERMLTTPRHYAYMKISEGCDRICSFCAIPAIRGKHRSKPVEDLLREASNLAAMGVKELILIAQDLTYYGVDLHRKQMLPDLLKRISDLGHFAWIRLHYAYPASFPPELVTVMRERDNICKYLDIPFQHISDKVLRNMRRNHSKHQALDLIHWIRAEVPGITLRTTLLVGHPGEGEDEFNELMDFVSTQRFERLGVFTYSEEENTHAALNFSDAIPASVKKKRADQVMSLQQTISREINESLVGKSLRVIIDRAGSGYFTGRTEGDSPEVDNEVMVKNTGKNIGVGEFHTIKITSAEDYDLTGEVIS